MDMKVLFDVPDNIVAGLATGRLVRNGGVIQTAPGSESGGNVVAWLREISSSPVANQELMGQSPSQAMQFLQMAGSVSSILNLGATVGFGIAALSRFKKMDKKLDRVIEDIERLQWTVELGFASMLSILEKIDFFQEVELLGEIKSAMSMAWSAQFFEPGSSKREQQMLNVLNKVSSVFEKYLLITQSEIESTILNLGNQTSSQRVQIDAKTINTVKRLRTTVFLANFQSEVMAEIENLRGAADFCEQQHKALKHMVDGIGYAFLRGNKDSESLAIYPALMNVELKDLVPASRIGRWAVMFDTEAPNGVYDVMEYLRDYLEQLEKSVEKSVENFIRGNNIFQRRIMLKMSGNSPCMQISRQDHLLSQFLDHVEGACSDIERFSGRAAEYNWARLNNKNLTEYRKMLEIDSADEDDDKKLAIILPG